MASEERNNSVVVTAEVVVCNEAGLHARPSHALVKTASEFEAQIRLSLDGRSADAGSILSVMTLGATAGSQIRIEAEGADAQAALSAIVQLFESGFDEGS
ncbi:MAG: HPr family phosphocarrier protein [Planctomycetota bacterium]|nr:HPr family phosphocarrier protein [Planctomycetota bacterium]